jgi:peptidoglycan/xylan/chitin deacetylase (PgdA/CDA1 family)
MAAQNFVRKIAKTSLSGLLQAGGAFRLARRLNRHRLLVLTYHGVMQSTDGPDSWLNRNMVDTATFRWQMEYLAKTSTCMTLGQAVARLRHGTPLPPNSVAVTFDDGFRNNYTQAFPVLMDCGVPATIFLTTGHIGRGMQLLWTERVARLISGMKRPVVRLELGDEPRRWWVRSEAEREQASSEILKLLKRLPVGLREDRIAELVKQVEREEEPTSLERYEFLNWDDVRAMAAAGIEFGSHTVHHPVLSTLDGRQRLEEVVRSKETIERELRQPCRVFSYPNGGVGDFGDTDRRVLRQVGYTGAATQIPGFNDLATDPFAVRRVNIGRGHTRLVFTAQLSGLWQQIKAVSDAA